ncbi:pentapeptide repeat-containing protein, partial [Clostridioides difficile]
MTLANLKKAGFIKCNFRNSSATYANFTMTNLTDSNLSG